MTVTPNGGFLYVAGKETGSSKTSQIFVIGTATNTVVDAIPVPADKTLAKVTFSPDGSLAYFVMTPDQPGSAELLIQVINVSTSDVVNTLPVSVPAAGPIIDLELSHDGGTLYLSLNDGLYFLNVASNTVIGFTPINASLFGASSADLVKMHGTAMTPDGSQIYLSAALHPLGQFDATATNLFVIDLASRTVVHHVTAPRSAPVLAWGDPVIGPDRACGEDFTTQVFVSKSSFSTFIFPQLQLQFATVINFRTQPIRGPITLFLTNLKNAIYVGNNATSKCYSSGGVPYTVVSPGPDNIFSPGEVVIVPLLFFKTGSGPITYDQQVASGSPGQ